MVSVGSFLQRVACLLVFFQFSIRAREQSELNIQFSLSSMSLWVLIDFVRDVCSGFCLKSIINNS